MKNRQSVAMVPLLLLLFSCQELFTTSLAAPLARDTAKLYATLSTDDLADSDFREDLLVSIKGNPSALVSVYDRIESLSQDASEDEALLLATVAASLAGDAFNLVAVLPSLLSAFSEVEEGEEPDPGLLLEEAFGANTALEEAAASLVAILPSSSDSAWSDFVAAADTDSLVFAGLSILIAQAIDAPDFVDYVENFDFASASLGPEEALAVDLLSAALGAAPASILDALLGAGEEEGGID